MKRIPLDGSGNSNASSALTAIVLATLTISAAMAQDQLCPPVQIDPLRVGKLDTITTRYSDKAKEFGQGNIARFLRNGRQARTDFYALWETRRNKETGVDVPIHPIYIISPEENGIAFYYVTGVYQSANIIKARRVQPDEEACKPGSYVVYATGDPKPIKKS